MNTCRICKQQEFGEGAARLFKYGTRHYVHGACGINRFGLAFLDMIPAHMLGKLPYWPLREAGMLSEVERRMAAAKKESA